jgi:Dolichyl-phosphate-mannose-protein mannosyltransferase
MDHGPARGDLSPASRPAGAAAPGPAAPGRPTAAAPGPAPPGRPTAAAAPQGATRHRAQAASSAQRAAVSWLPLLAVLIFQAGFSVRLLGADTAFQDEGTYLWAGHLEWAHLLHGAPLPPFASYFSGAPVIYPPAGALADSAGGLAGARLLSLAFMLGCTVLLWDVTRRLAGRRAAFFAAALFAVLGPTLHLGSFATYDAMALLLLALATWLAVAAGDHGEATGRMAAAGVVLALANATAYATALFDPVVIAVAALVVWPAGRRVAARRALTLLIVAAVVVTAGLLLGGSSYLTGITQTTLHRAPGSDPSPAVLLRAWSWTGVIIVLAGCGVLTSWAAGQDRRRSWLLVVLTLAALLGPVEQALLHTTDSLNKHVGLGAWFAAIAAGYAADAFIAGGPAGRARTLTTAGCVLALVFPALFGIVQSRDFATSWPSSASFIGVLRPLAGHGDGRLLVEDPGPARYYLPAGAQWQRWSSTRNIVLPGGASTGGPRAGVVAGGDPAAFARYISQGYFSYVALNFADTTALDHQIRADLGRNHRYRIIQVVPYNPPGSTGQLTGTYVIWRYQP